MSHLQDEINQVGRARACHTKIEGPGGVEKVPRTILEWYHMTI